MCLPVSIHQRWEVSVAVSKCAEWRQWFQNLDHTQQKAYVESIAKKTKETFWTRLLLEYEEHTEPRQTRLVAAAARAMVMLEVEKVKMQMRELWQFRPAQSPSSKPDPSSDVWKKSMAGMKVAYARCPKPPAPKTHQGYELDYGPEEYIKPRSAFLTVHNSISLGVRHVPSYFRLPSNAFQFAEQMFRGKSHDECVAEQKANFASWTRESRVQRVEGAPGYVVWGNIAVHQEAVKRRYQKSKAANTE